MSIFRLYLELGISHIANFKGYDHILFITALCAIYSMQQWRQVLILITAFTLGHTLTLALATLSIIRISSSWIEFLIPLTIFVTALGNILFVQHNGQPFSIWRLKYAAALFFGLIHGLGFSTYLRGLLGTEQNLITPLFAFNLGIETGQIVIVAMVLFLAYLIINWLHFPKRYWERLLSIAGMGISLALMIERLPW